MVAPRLSSDDWVGFALKTLASDGYGSLRAERLASGLGVSRGSFYWHFEDVGAFDDAVLTRWEEVAVDTPYAEALSTGGESGAPALQALIRRVFDAPVDLERAVRSWAVTSPRAAKSVSRVDQRRVDMLTGLLPLASHDAAAARTRAVILYWSYLGHVATGGKMKSDAVIATLLEQMGVAERQAAAPEDRASD